MSLPRYPKYKPSGVEWLGDVPEGWEVDRIKRSVLSSKNGVWGAEPQQDESDIPCVRVADFDRQKLRVELSEPTIRNVVESERVGRVLCKGDLLLEKAGGGELQPVGCVVLYDDDRPAVCSNFVARVQVAPGMNASFWRYAHAAAYAVRLNTRSIKQTSGIQNLDGSQYFDESAAFPPLPEQTAIAEFLDRETAKIDGLVAEQRRLMELLKEKRQAVISHAVTKGLDPHAPMKPSGIEWLGDVPEHWKVIPIKWLSPVKRGASPRPIDDPKYFDEKGEYAWVRIADVSACDGVLSETTQRLSPLGSSLSVKIFPNELFISIAGTVGKPCISAIKACIHDGFVYFPTLKINPWFLFRIFEAGDCYGGLGKWGTQLNLNTDTVGSIRVAIPPADEVYQLLKFMDDESSRFDTLTAEAQRAIDLLQERRTALISAAVTGQIDVRQHLKN